MKRTSPKGVEAMLPTLPWSTFVASSKTRGSLENFSFNPKKKIS